MILERETMDTRKDKMAATESLIRELTDCQFCIKQPAPGADGLSHRMAPTGNRKLKQSPFVAFVQGDQMDSGGPKIRPIQ